MPRISVIIPTYNRAGFVREAIESVLRQTYRDLEVIVVDDGSIDNTKEVVSNYEDPRVRYIYQENQGVSGALNTGIKAAQAEYIAMLASDNVLFKDALQKCIDFMDPHPEVGFCYGQIFTMDGRGHLLRSKKLIGPKTTYISDGNDEIIRLLLGEPSIGYFIVRTACFENIGLFNTTLRMSEDWDMLFRLAKSYSVGLLAEPLGIVREHNQSMTAKNGVEIVKKAHTAVLESIFNDPEVGPLYAHMRRKAHFGLYCLLARVAARTGHKGPALLYVFTALKTYPKSLMEKKGRSILIRTGKSFLPRWLKRFIARTLILLRLR